MTEPRQRPWLSLAARLAGRAEGELPVVRPRAAARLGGRLWSGVSASLPVCLGAGLCLSLAGCQSWLAGRSVFERDPVVEVVAATTADSPASTSPTSATTRRAQEATGAGELLMDQVSGSREPHRLLAGSPPVFRDCQMEELREVAIKNIAIIRDRQSFLGGGNTLLNNPDQVASEFDPSIQETGGPSGGRGEPQAQADYDPFFSARTLWGKNELVQNNRFLSGGLAPGAILGESSAAFTARVDQLLSSGGLVSVGQDWNYNRNNMPARLYPSYYAGRLFGEFRQPLLAGAGSDFTEVAGPLVRNVAGNTVNQGVAIARLNTEMSMYDFESRVQALLKNVEDAWWDLALAYAAYDAEVESRDAALRTWEKVKGRFENGLEGIGAADEAQARESYYERCSLADDALTTVYEREAQLRRLVGLNVSDGRLIRPIERLESSEAAPDWHQALASALTQRMELRRQKANLRGLAAQCGAAESLTRPRLDFISGYQLNGFGDDLFDTGASNPPYPSAYADQFANQQTGWNLGFEFSMPIGFRAAEGRRQNLELRMAKATAALAAQELEISHELAHAFQQVDRALAVSQSNGARRDAARQRVEALEAEHNAGRITPDLLLRAQASLFQAEVAFNRSFCEYRKALAELAYRSGVMLDRAGVTLAEAPPDPEAHARVWQASLKRVQSGQVGEKFPVSSLTQPVGHEETAD